MGVFNRKPVESTRQSAQVLMLPLSPHEAREVVELIAAVRGGDVHQVERRLQALQVWNPVRAVFVLGALSERYLKFLIDSKAVCSGEDTGAVVRDLARLEQLLPTTVRPGEGVMEDALTICVTRDSDTTKRRLVSDPAGVCVALTYLCAAMCTMSNDLPQTAKPTLPDMLHGIVAPW